MGLVLTGFEAQGHPFKPYLAAHAAYSPIMTVLTTYNPLVSPLSAPNFLSQSRAQKLSAHKWSPRLKIGNFEP